MRRRRIIGATLAVLLGASVLTAAASPSASPPIDPGILDDGMVSYAAPGGGTTFETDTSKVTVMPAAETKLSAKELAALAPTFGCSLNVQNPHGSTHVAGTINVVAVVTCDIPAGSLKLALNLIRVSPNNRQWAAIPTKVNTDQRTIQNNVATSCSEGPGNFQGWGWATLTPPPGYQLSGSPDIKKYGNMVAVACGVPFAAEAGATEEPAESIEFTFIRTDLAD